MYLCGGKLTGSSFFKAHQTFFHNQFPSFPAVTWIAGLYWWPFISAQSPLLILGTCHGLRALSGCCHPAAPIMCRQGICGSNASWGAALQGVWRELVDGPALSPFGKENRDSSRWTQVPQNDEAPVIHSGDLLVDPSFPASFSCPSHIPLAYKCFLGSPLKLLSLNPEHFLQGSQRQDHLEVLLIQVYW